MPADVSQLLALADEFDQAGPKVARATVEVVKAAADAGVQAGAAVAPRRTGDLAGSGEVVMSGGGGLGGAQARVRFTEPYAWYVYAGTARQAPQPAFIDAAHDAAEAKGNELLGVAIAGALP